MARAVDSPFLGAHSQVPGARRNLSEAAAQRSSTPLPLAANDLAWEPGWVVRLPVRAEHILVEKQVVVRERVVVQGMRFRTCRTLIHAFGQNDCGWKSRAVRPMPRQ